MTEPRNPLDRIKPRDLGLGERCYECKSQQLVSNSMRFDVYADDHPISPRQNPLEMAAGDMLSIKQEPVTSGTLRQQASVSIAFTVSSVLEVEVVDRGWHVSLFLP